MIEIVVADIGGTHARFAIAKVEGGRVVALGEPEVFQTAEHEGLESAWTALRARLGRDLPSAAAFALATLIEGGVLRFPNNHWTLPLAEIRTRLGIERHLLLNDLGAAAHAVAQLDTASFRHLFGPDRPLPEEGVISVVGPGTGLGAAILARRGGACQVIETEGGHIGFAPVDEVEDRILRSLRARFGRVSVERVGSGPGLAVIAEALAAPGAAVEEKALWQAALDEADALASAALERFCMTLGSAVGDLALAQGAEAVVIAGGLGQRLADRLARSGFRERFLAKGRYGGRMEAMPVKLVTHPQPGLYGAAAAFAGAAQSGEI